MRPLRQKNAFGETEKLSFPRKRESTAFIKPWIPDQVGDDSKSTDMIVELSFSNVSIGNPEVSINPGFRIKCGMTKRMDPHFHGDDSKAVMPSVSEASTLFSFK